MTYFISELFALVDKASTRDEKKDILLNNQTKALIEILRLNFDPNIKFAFFDKPKVKPNGAPAVDLAPNHLFKTYRYLSRFVKPEADEIDKGKLERLLLVSMESMYVDEAEIFYDVIRKRLKVRGLTENLVREIFPGLLSEKKKETPKGKSKGGPKKNSSSSSNGSTKSSESETPDEKRNDEVVEKE